MASEVVFGLIWLMAILCSQFIWSDFPACLFSSTIEVIHGDIILTMIVRGVIQDWLAGLYLADGQLVNVNTCDIVALDWIKAA